MWELTGADIAPMALQGYVEEQIYTLPGTDRHRDEFTVLLTGSRALGTHTPSSDVDLDVVCPRDVYQSVLQASYAAGIITSDRGFFCVLHDESWHRYFGEQMGRPHFSLTPLDVVERQFHRYEDVPLWIWSNAQTIVDPDGQFARLRAGFHGYPPDVLVRKIKYHWLSADYAGIDIYPFHHVSDDELLPAVTGISTMVNELLRVFYLVEGKPYPYAERLLRHAADTALGREFLPMLQRAMELVVGKIAPERDAWSRLDEAIELMLCGEEAKRLETVCLQAIVTAGVDPRWAEADFDNIDELLSGELGPAP